MRRLNFQAFCCEVVEHVYSASRRIALSAARSREGTRAALASKNFFRAASFF